MRLRLALVAAITLAATDVGAAPPTDTKACIEAFDQGQRSRSDGKLLRAQTELLVCTREACPAVLRADCSSVLRAVQSAIPSIVFAADDGEGHDITDVSVHLGTDVVATRLDARAVEYDPGTYDFRFERSKGTSVTVHQVLREGERNRVVRASFPSPKPIAAKRELAPTPPPSRSAIGIAVPAGLAGVGLLALGFAGFSRLRFDGDVDDLQASCAPNCTAAQRDDLSSTLVTANVSLVIGAVALVAAGATWFLLAPRATDRPTRVGAW